VKLNQLYKNIPQKWVQLAAFYAVALAFILLNSWLLLEKNTLLGVVVPIAVLVLITAVLSYQRLIWLVVALTPLSIPFKWLYPGLLPVDMFIPTEPILFGILILFLFSISRGQKIGKDITRHPVSITLYFYLGWMALTTVTSTLPVVSIKYLLVHVWYIVIFFFLLTFLFKHQKNMPKLIWLYLLGLVPVIFYTIGRHFANGMHNDNAAHWVMTPFFNDHTSYGAVLAMFIPFLTAFVFSSWMSKKKRIWSGILLVIFIVAEILSFTRAAWLSLVAAIVVWGIIKLKIRFKTLAITGISIILLIFAFQNQILMKLEQNSTDSSANLTEHINSMTNISTDASNLERINRWQCAIAMFEEKPFLGWGPGTYAMNYAPFQLTGQRTIISTNAGDGGNAHSEYLGALSESGVPGMISFMLIIIVVLYTAINAYTRTNNKKLKTLLLASITALVTYYTHSFLNNFLDTDKVAIPFWGFTAIIVAIDLYTKQEKHTPETKW
jgi:putative inorganic carbon (HCO3(-)) transporter